MSPNMNFEVMCEDLALAVEKETQTCYLDVTQNSKKVTQSFTFKLSCHSQLGWVV